MLEKLNSSGEKLGEILAAGKRGRKKKKKEKKDPGYVNRKKVVMNNLTVFEKTTNYVDLGECFNTLALIR